MQSYPDFCCPQCKGLLDSSDQEHSCARCVRKYPVVLGIPDFRVFPDPYIDYTDDYKKSAYLLKESENTDFKGLVKFYWKITPEVSEDRAGRFMRRTFALVDKGIETLKEIEALATRSHPMNLNAALEVGCGTGGFLVAATRRFKHVVGVDIAFRWLIIARKRLEEAGLNVPLVCACAEYMPFRKDIFDLVVAENVIEHVCYQEKTLQDCSRVLSKAGVLFLATPNRFSVTAEPHVRVWGVGFLPRILMNRYVQLVKGITYEHIKVLSFFEIKRLLKRCSLKDHQILLPRVSEKEVREFSSFEKIQVAIYNWGRKMPFLRLLLYLMGPSLHVICYANKGHDGKGSSR